MLENLFIISWKIYLMSHQMKHSKLQLEIYSLDIKDKLLNVIIVSNFNQIMDKRKNS